MRPSLALSVARILLRVPTVPVPTPKWTKNYTPTPAPRNPDDEERAGHINAMTNWQRTQWARAGYSRKLSELRRFRAMTRRPEDKES